jgi:hypothetical protein
MSLHIIRTLVREAKRLGLGSLLANAPILKSVLNPVDPTKILERNKCHWRVTTKINTFWCLVVFHQKSGYPPSHCTFYHDLPSHCKLLFSPQLTYVSGFRRFRFQQKVSASGRASASGTASSSAFSFEKWFCNL